MNFIKNFLILILVILFVTCEPFRDYVFSKVEEKVEYDLEQGEFEENDVTVNVEQESNEIANIEFFPKDLEIKLSPYKKYLDELLQKELLAYERHSSTKDKVFQRFFDLNKQYRNTLYVPTKIKKELQHLAKKLEKKRHPFVLFSIIHFYSNNDKKFSKTINLLNRCLKNRKKFKPSAYLNYLIDRKNFDVRSQYRKRSKRLNNNAIIKSLFNFVVSLKSTPKNDYIVYHFLENHFDDYIDKKKHTKLEYYNWYKSNIARAISKKSNWLKKLFEASYQMKVGWFHRTGEYASEVSDEQFKKFHKHFEEAYDLLIEVVDSRPQYSCVAELLIEVEGVLGSEEKTLKWFHRGIRAEYDNIDLYTKLSWFIMPRWGGSWEKLDDFYNESLVQNHFDTKVPLLITKNLIENLRADFIEDGILPLKYRKKIYNYTKEIFARYKKSVVSPQTSNFNTPFYRNNYLFDWASFVEEYEDVVKIYNNHKELLTPEHINKFPRIYALSFKGARKYVEIIDNNTSWATHQTFRKDINEVQTLISNLEKAKELVPGARAKPFFQMIEKKLEIEKKFFSTKEWIPLLFDRNFSTWSIANGDFNFVDTHSVIAQDFFNRRPHYILPELFIPAPYELEVDIKVIKSFMRFPIAPGIIVGRMSSGERDGYAFFIESGNKAGAYDAHFKEVFSKPIPKAEVHKLKVKILGNKKTEVWVNDKLVIKEENSRLVPARFGLGQCRNYLARGKVMYSNFRVRRL